MHPVPAVQRAEGEVDLGRVRVEVAERRAEGGEAFVGEDAGGGVHIEDAGAAFVTAGDRGEGSGSVGLTVRVADLRWRDFLYLFLTLKYKVPKSRRVR